MRRIVGILLACLLICFWFPLLAQSAPDSLDLVIERLVAEEVEEQLSWLKLVGISSLAVITVYGVYMFFFGIKTKVESVLEDQISDVTKDRIADAFGVKAEIVKDFFRQLEKEAQVLNSRILIVNKSGKKDINLISRITKGGFHKDPTYQSLAAIQSQLDANNYDLVLFDDRDGLLSESEVTGVIDAYPKAFRFVCLTSQDWSKENYLKYTRRADNRLQLLKDANYLLDNLKKALL